MVFEKEKKIQSWAILNPETNEYVCRLGFLVIYICLKGILVFLELFLYDRYNIVLIISSISEGPNSLECVTSSTNEQPQFMAH